MKKVSAIYWVGVLFLFLFACTKQSSMLNDPTLSGFSKKNNIQMSNVHLNATTGGEFVPPAGSDLDTIETPTILGPQMPNPYALDNMTMAYNIVHSTNKTRLAPTDLYVRFKPTDQDQLETLAETLDLDLFDTPMDYSIVQEGDYYQDPSIPMEQITWQYAVVKPGFQFPTGITHEILDSIYIPSNSDYEVEDMAFQLLGDSDIDNPSPYSMVIPQLRDLKCAPGRRWSEAEQRCVSLCPPGQHWSPEYGGHCVSDANPPTPPPPPPPSGPGSHYPAGYLKVFDTNLNDNVPVGKARVVVKRWFKIQRLYTDNDGYFESSKRFHKKAKVIVKFKNHDGMIREMKGLRLWQAIFPVKKKLGVYSGTLNNISYTFGRYSASIASKGNRYWAAATAHNGLQEVYDFDQQNGITPPPSKLKIFLSPWGRFAGSSVAPMFNSRPNPSGLSDNIVIELTVGLLSVIPPISLLTPLVSAQDILIDVHRDDLNDFTSDFIKGMVFHECTHASELQKAGYVEYTQFVNAVFHEYSSGSSAYQPYGDGNSSYSDIIALYESLAYQFGHIIASEVYGKDADCQSEQKQFVYCNNLHTEDPNIKVLEYFQPNYASDVFRWIPKGIYRDLIDDGNEPGVSNIDDQVSGYTHEEIFGAFNSSTKSMTQYKNSLLQLYGTSQEVQVNSLFSQYGY